MDDSCAVCADNLEWVAYGSCGHRDVCSTCVARLRFICDDRRCCICKTHSDFVFVTKALGDYTRMVTDLSTLASQTKEGKVGSYWYHQDTQAFFDDPDHYRMVKAMCRLSCSICHDEQQQHDLDHDDDDDQVQVQVQVQVQGHGRGGGGGRHWRPRGRGGGHDQQHHVSPVQDRRRQRFRNIGHLKAHLNHQHHLFMCELCLEGRKVFICEQKLYTRAQLNQHKRTGDSEVDGTESERGGFTGHPMCEFCRSSFYSENELYTHMSTEHYTCHICQRRHPEQYDYFRDYDDLEAHFRHDHFLCEDEACLAKKFTVFQTEADLKRHNALEHGGRMSRSKRNAVLQIPTSFRYRSNNESGYHRGRRRSFRRETSPDNELRMAIQASLNSANTGAPVSDPSLSSSAAPVVGDYADTSDVEPLVQPFESLSTSDSELSSRYLHAVSQISARPLEESSFPPLSAPPATIQRTQPEVNAAAQNTMAARLRRKSNATVQNVARPMPAKNRGAVPTVSDSWPAPVLSTSSVQMKPVTATGSGSSSYATSLQARQAADHRLSMGGSWVKTPGIGSRSKHSSSAPNLLEIRTFDSVSDFPPVSTAQSNRALSSGQASKMDNDVHTANKSLVERIRAALDFDEEKYSSFKEMSQEYRQGVIGTLEYLEYVKQYDLVHLVLDLARLCPDTKKQRELIEAYNTSTQNNVSEETFWGNGQIKVGGSSSSSRKDNGKKVARSEKLSPKDVLADNVLDTVRSLQSQMKQHEGGEAEVLGKEGYRTNKGKSTLTADEKLGSNQYQPESTIGNQNLGAGSGKQKKMSKFHRIRLGDASPSAILDVRSSGDPEPDEVGPNSTEGQSTRGVWRNGGGHRLFAK